MTTFNSIQGGAMGRTNPEHADSALTLNMGFSGLTFDRYFQMKLINS